MQRSKNQAVYKFLPEIWISDKNDDGRAVSAKIKNWNYIKMDGVYENFIQNEIKRQIRLFGERNGDISAFNISHDNKAFEIVEAACNEGIPDIIGVLSPLVFYCSSCGNAYETKNPENVYWKCKNEKCKKNSIKQLQMIYACECGFAQPITIPKIKGVKEYRYRPNENPYKMFYSLGNAEKPAEFSYTCPTCNSRLLPDNASSGKNYKPFTLRIINLVDHNSGKFYEKGLDAQKVIISRWFGKITTVEYDRILNNIELAFSDEFTNDSKRKKAEESVRQLIACGLIQEDKFNEAVATTLAADDNSISVEKYVARCNECLPADIINNTYWINNFSFRLMQYYTLKYAKRTITLEDSIRRQMEMEFIDSPDDIYTLNRIIGIDNMQVSCDIQIVNCTYGYSRKVADPKNNTNKNCRLKLNAYDKTKDGTANLVFSTKLDTEGILFEISQKKIIEWLYKNKIIREEQLPDLEDELSVKKWFSEYVHSDVISMFGEIDDKEIITKHVFALLHSMSHAFINTAGELSGLSSNSLTEIIIVETASIFIYAQTSQGIPLGALSGMAESNYYYFLRKVYDESKNCIFDPICSERDSTACSACLVIPEISCNHFNAELGRKYLYSFLDGSSPSVGFWEM